MSKQDDNSKNPGVGERAATIAKKAHDSGVRDFHVKVTDTTTGDHAEIDVKPSKLFGRKKK